MEFNTVPELSRPAYFAGVVIGKFVLFKSFKEYAFLLFGRFENELNSSLEFHVHILVQYLQIFKSGFLPYLTESIADLKEKQK